MGLTAKDVQEIMSLLEGSSFDRLSLELDGLKLELERGVAGAPPRVRESRSRSAPPSPEASAKAAPPPAGHKRKSSEDGLIEITAPLLGIFYRAPKPGETPFVDVGGRVEAETAIGIIEVMKLMNSVPAGVTGEIVEILGQNGELVEHGEVLMLVRPDAD